MFLLDYIEDSEMARMVDVWIDRLSQEDGDGLGNEVAEQAAKMAEDAAKLRALIEQALR